MSIDKCVALGMTGNKISKEIAGTSEVSVGRTAVATSAGAVAGGVAGGAVVIGTTALGVATAPVVVPLAVGSAVVAGIASLFD